MASNYSRKSASSDSRRAQPHRRPRPSAPQRDARHDHSPAMGSARTGRTRRAPQNIRRLQNVRPSQGARQPQRHPQPRRTPPSGYRPRRSAAPFRTYAAPSTQRISSVRLGDLQDGRAARLQSSYQRYTRKILAALGILAAIVAIYALLYVSGVFGIKNVTVHGCEHLTAEEVSTLAAVPENSTLLRVDSAGICSRLETNPWVQSASVSPHLPDTLEINITERTIDAVVEVITAEGNATQNWAIASDGIWLMSIPDKNSSAAAQVPSKVYEDADKVLHITGVPYGVAPVAGGMCTDDSVKNALNIVSGMTTELAGQVKSVKADSSDNATLTLQNGVEIAFGSADDIREKERICLELINKHQGSIAYINVRVPSNPTYRAL